MNSLRNRENDRNTDNGKKERPEEYSLGKFVENNINLLTTLGIFSALTVFAFSLPMRAYSFILSAAFLTGTILIWLELWTKFPSQPSNWRLTLFENVVSLAIIVITIYYLNVYIIHIRWLLTFFIWLIIMGNLSRTMKVHNIYDRLFKRKAKYRLLRYIIGIVLIILTLALSTVISTLLAQCSKAVLDSLHSTAVEFEEQLDSLPQNGEIDIFSTQTNR